MSTPDGRPWLVRILDPDGDASTDVRAIALFATAVVHLGLGTDARTLCREAEEVSRWL